MVQFDNRGLLSTHLARGSGICWLNMILWVPPLTSTQLADARKASRAIAVVRERTGISATYAEVPVFRVPGPLMVIYDFDSTIVPSSSNRHPFGPQKRKYLDVDVDTS